ncbi:MAG: flagellar export chaperone FliS [Gemmatimonadaceae bacterium]
MSYANNAAQYQEVAVRSAAPGQLIVMVYDHLLLNLRRARLSMEQGNVELRLTSFDRARQALGELLATLDQDQGGEMARQLNALYAFLLGELTDLGIRPELARLDRVIGISADLRESFAAIAQHPATREVA